MKKYISAFVLSLTGTIVFAQGPAISLGGGISKTSASLKNSAQIGNGYQLNGDAFIPLLRKGWDGVVKGGSKFEFGIVAGGEYNSAKNLIPDAAIIQSNYKLTNGNYKVFNTQKGSANANGFTGFAGLQANFNLGRITISPSISGAYFTLTQNGFAQSAQLPANGTTQMVIFLETSKTKTNGFLTRPQLKLSYSLTGNLSFYVDGALNIGPDVNTTQSHLVPAGGYNAKNTYETTQLTTGTAVNQSTLTRYQTATFNAGLTLSFGSANASSRRHYKGKITKPGDGGVRNMVVADPQADGATNGTPMESASEEKRTYTAGHKNENIPVESVSEEKRTYTAGHKNENIPVESVSEEKRTYTAGHKNENIPVESVSEEKRTYTAGHKNENIPVESVSEEKRTYTAGHKNENADNDVKTNPLYQDNGNASTNPLAQNDVKTNPLYHGNGNSGTNPLYENKDRIAAPTGNAGSSSPEQLVAGNPIGGIIVKGGKNPGGSFITVVTDSKGRFELKNITAGDYLFTITTPSKPAGKGISEKGVKRSQNMAAPEPGSPIGGIVVKGGKNPGGSSIVVKTNNKGQIQLKGLKKGNYLFVVTAP